MLKKYCFIVLTNPVAGREDEYNDWYSRIHLKDVLDVPGFVSAQRFVLSDASPASAFKYLAIYEVLSEDVRSTFEEMYRRAGTAAMFVSDALDQTGTCATLFEELTPRVIG